jgi:hypothetical protein
MSNGALVRAQQSTLEQRNDPMYSGQQMLGMGRLMLLDLPVVNVAFQFAVGLQSVAYDCTAQFDGFDNKTMQGGSIGIGARFSLDLKRQNGSHWNSLKRKESLCATVTKPWGGY